MTTFLSDMFGLLSSSLDVASNASSTASCRCFPGDACWPTNTQWNDFNHTVGGNLISSVPLAAVCHNNDAFTTYNLAECTALQDSWYLPETHLVSSSSPMSYLFTNNTCNPFSTPDSGCTLGNLVSYAVNATSTSDIQQTLAFANKHNVRLVIRNSGHDYNGKSTGAGALGLWLHYLDGLEYLSKYQSWSYSGPAIKVGAGVSIYDAYKFADTNDGIIVGGNCPTVALAGGYSQ